jgi:hypothetical protein
MNFLKIPIFAVLQRPSPKNYQATMKWWMIIGVAENFCRGKKLF